MKNKLKIEFQKRIVSYFILLCLSISLYSGAHISVISTDPEFKSSSLFCGMTGGCRLYIQGTGFDTNYENQVLVGTYPCVIDNYYTSDILIVCEMPALFYGLQSDLQVIMKVKDKIIECKYRDCTVNFVFNRSPSLYSVTPQSVFAGDTVSLGGYFKASTVADLKEIRISKKNCEITEEQLEYDNLSYGGYSTLNCIVPEDMENGNHKMSITSGMGTGFLHPLRDSVGFTVGTSTEEYNLRVHPKITQISSNSGYLNGQLIEIKGNGFGNIKEDIEVKLEDVSCIVLSLEELSEINEQDEPFKSQKITCSLNPRSQDFTQKMFKGGVGVRNQVFDGSTSNFASLMGDVTKEIRYDKTLLSMENFLNESDYTQRIWGIFTSLDAGKYTFKISGDDYTSLYLSENPINFDETFDRSTLPDPICYIQGWTDFRMFNRYPTQICEYTLEANKDYYMMVFQQEGGGADHVTVGVTVPNVDNTKPNQSPQVQKITINNTPDRQELLLKIMNAIGGTFTLVFQERDPDTGASTYFKESANLDYDIEDELLCTRIRQTIGTECTAVRKYLDQNKNVTNNATNAKGFQWEISFTAFRTRDIIPAIKSDNLTGSGVNVNIEETKSQSDQVEGHFTLKYNNIETGNIEYYYSGNNMETRLRELPDLFEGISAYTEGSRYDGYTWYVSMDSIVGQSLDIKLGTNSLTGGKNGNPSISIQSNFISPTLAQTFMPIPSDLLRTINTSPQIVVKIGDHLAGCDLDNCSYNYLSSENTPSVTSFSLSGMILTINVDNPSGRILTTSDEACLLYTSPSPRD